MKSITVNFMMPVWIALALYAGYTGKVSWWAIMLMALMEVKLRYTFSKR